MIKQISTLAVIGMLISACAFPAQLWRRIDGGAAVSAQLSADELVCKGEAHKANASAGKAGVDFADQLGYSDDMMAVFNGCMAQRGYVQR